ncbi:transcriptional regulator, GntR family [Xylanimonas cellulosilytica DSM 15894]|uniref:Transcriptional regulator, GntR family n=1 Tax=Xylanimonas cellulosilytica (strain DSM 15894 / JCM 12276 / CECT 5975 / KCTC 9989 / LMG 20990 / NBRC 107835 / XIL07) TaxID=446471 RepID=D1BVI1_XYLCX|nr:GntR family transcriptional regulator [Xylanimonas cellulosilytica]ACZ29452.1 transcriptional regulator, GntR family [Xylanimonas cellulosilytica DSM 15894]
MFSGETPVFQQLAAKIADDIVAGVYPEETAVPSATDFAAFHRMNPATASKGVNLLVDLGALYKRRGVGMFVAPGARVLLKKARREQFQAQYVRPFLAEARLLGIGRDELHQMIDEEVGQS